MDSSLGDSSLILYQTEDGQTRVEVRLLDETVWLTQAQMAELFSKDKRTISEHIQNIFKEGELPETAVIRKFRTTAADGKNMANDYYWILYAIYPSYCVNNFCNKIILQYKKKLSQVHLALLFYSVM